MPAESGPKQPILSICIATYNRARFIGSTLDSIIPQLTDACEIVVLDSSPNEDTADVVAHLRGCSQLRYIKQCENRGVDEDYDRTVQHANGKYCWLMTDDDLMRPGAVKHVLGLLQRDVSLLIVNVEIRDFSLTRIIQRGWLNRDSDETYQPHQMDNLFVAVGEILKYIGCVIIKRGVWMARERKRYYGSWFVHVGVLFQAPLPSDSVIVAQPCIVLRMGNAKTFSSKIAELVWDKWPSILESSSLTPLSRDAVPSAQPWRDTREMLRLRAVGVYSLDEYYRWVQPRLSGAQRWKAILIALAPATIVNALSVVYYSVAPFHPRGLWLQELSMSPWNLKNRISSLRGGGAPAT